MATTTDGKTRFAIIWVSTNVLRSCQRNAESLAKAITGRLTRALSTCLRMKEAYVDDLEASDENSKSRLTQIQDLFIHLQTTKARPASMSRKFKTSTRRHILTTATAQRLPFLRALQPDSLRCLGSISRNTPEIPHHRNTYLRNRVCSSMAEATKVINHTRMAVSKRSIDLKLHCPTFHRQRDLSQENFGKLLSSLFMLTKCARYRLSSLCSSIPFGKLSLRNFIHAC